VATFAGATALLLLLVAIGAPIAAFRIDRERGAAERNAQAEARERTRAEHNLYASDMNLAQQALKLNNLGRARRLLDRTGRSPARKTSAAGNGATSGN
jgi:hypothetical protein